MADSLIASVFKRARQRAAGAGSTSNADPFSAAMGQPGAAGVAANDPMRAAATATGVRSVNGSGQDQARNPQQFASPPKAPATATPTGPVGVEGPEGSFAGPSLRKGGADWRPGDMGWDAQGNPIGMPDDFGAFIDDGPGMLPGQAPQTPGANKDAERLQGSMKPAELKPGSAQPTAPVNTPEQDSILARAREMERRQQDMAAARNGAQQVGEMRAANDAELAAANAYVSTAPQGRERLAPADMNAPGVAGGPNELPGQSAVQPNLYGGGGPRQGFTPPTPGIDPATGRLQGQVGPGSLPPWMNPDGSPVEPGPDAEPTPAEPPPAAPPPAAPPQHQGIDPNSSLADVQKQNPGFGSPTNDPTAIGYKPNGAGATPPTGETPPAATPPVGGTPVAPATPTTATPPAAGAPKGRYADELKRLDEMANVGFDEGDSTEQRTARIARDDSSLMQLAATRARQAMAGRGLVNSSMAIGAEQAAVLDKASQIAAADAQLATTAKQANATRRVDAGKFGIQTTESGRQADQTDTTNRYGIDTTASTARRGQDVEERASIRSNETQRYGIDTGAETTRRGQDITKDIAAAEDATRRYGIDADTSKAIMADQTNRYSIDKTDEQARAKDLTERYGIDANTAAAMARDMTERYGIDTQKQIATAKDATDRYGIDTSAGIEKQKLTESGRQFDAGLGLEQQKLSQQGDQFLKSLGLERDKLTQQDAQFLASLDLDKTKLTQQDKQFFANLAESGRQFDTSTALEKDKITNQKDQFNRSLMEQARQANQTYGLGQQQIASQEKLAANDQAFRTNLANLDIASRKELATIESTWRTDIAKNENISNAWGTTQQAISQIQNNPDLDPATKATMIQNATAGFGTFAKFWKSGNLDELLNFGVISDTPVKPGATGGAPGTPWQAPGGGDGGGHGDASSGADGNGPGGTGSGPGNGPGGDNW